jgi:hypothetical protein
MADQAVTLCPICKSDCDITEEDLIDADCGACGNAILSCSFLILFYPGTRVRFSWVPVELSC